MNTNKEKLKPKFLVVIFTILLLAFGQGKSANAGEHGFGYIPLDPETYQRYLKPWPPKVLEALPSSYDARNDNIIPETEPGDQGSCNSCWAFASVGAFESHLMKQFSLSLPGPDLSEQQQISCNLSMSGCCGGSLEAIKWWEIRGPVTEDCLAYEESGTTCNQNIRTIPCGNAFECDQLPYRVTNFHTITTSSATPVKTSVYNDGPCVFGFLVYDDFLDDQGGGFWSDANPGDVYVNLANSSERGEHAVLIIGWDDTKGAYLCQNSWGKTGGPNGDGTFWIAYSGHAHNLNFQMANFTLKELAINSAEYFIDTDPGEGNGIGLPAKDGAFDSPKETVELSLNTSNLKIGIHALYIRMQNKQGVWGTPRKTLFEVTGIKHIAEAEYFVDIDPGEGNGTPLLPLDGSFDQVKESINAGIDTSGLSLGLHTIYVRMEDSENHWGTVRGYKVEIREPPHLAAAEFFVDADPGIGSAYALVASDGSFDSSIEELDGYLDTTSIALGHHILYCRAMDSYFRWGNTEVAVFDIVEVGYIEGSVVFKGLPCELATASIVPPCTGPYPNYEVIVYKDDGVTIATQAYSDANGDYRISLIPGDYIIYTTSGPFGRQANLVTIVDGETTTLDLLIDTGIRTEGSSPGISDVGTGFTASPIKNTVKLKKSPKSQKPLSRVKQNR